MDNTLHSYILTTEILLNYEQALEYFFGTKEVYHGYDIGRIKFE